MRAPAKKLTILFNVGATIQIDKVDTKLINYDLDQWYLTRSGTIGIFFKTDIFGILKIVLNLPMVSDNMNGRFWHRPLNSKYIDELQYIFFRKKLWLK